MKGMTVVTLPLSFPPNLSPPPSYYLSPPLGPSLPHSQRKDFHPSVEHLQTLTLAAVVAAADQIPSHSSSSSASSCRLGPCPCHHTTVAHSDKLTKDNKNCICIDLISQQADYLLNSTRILRRVVAYYY